MNAVEWAKAIEARIRVLEARAPWLIGYDVAAADNCVSIRATPRPDVRNIGTGLGDFYTVVDEVSLADVGNGLFIHPIDSFLGDVPRSVPSRTIDDAQIFQFGSDGGGGLFIYDRAEQSVRYANGIEIANGVLVANRAELPRVAESFEGFLAGVTAAFDRFLASGEVWTPGA